LNAVFGEGERSPASKRPLLGLIADRRESEITSYE
jgi:hypothetical protein